MEELKPQICSDVYEVYALMKSFKRSTGKDSFVNFNNAILYSYDSINACYIKVTGMNRNRFMKQWRNEKRETKRLFRRFFSKRSKLRREYKEKARGILEEKYLAEWDIFVNRCLDKFDSSFLLKAILELASILNEDVAETDRFERGKLAMEDQSHTGYTASSTFYGLQMFHKDGKAFTEYVNSVRYGKV